MTFSGEGSQVHPKVLQASDLLLPLQRLHLVSHSLSLTLLAKTSFGESFSLSHSHCKDFIWWVILSLSHCSLVSHSLSIFALSSEPLAMWWNLFSTGSDGLQKVNHQHIGELFPITGFAEYKSAKTATETCVYSNMISVTNRIQGKSSWFNSAALKLFCWVNIRTSWTPVADIWSAVPVVSLNKTKPHYLIWGPGCLLSTEQNSSVWSDVPTDHSSLIKTQRTQEKVKRGSDEKRALWTY